MRLLELLSEIDGISSAKYRERLTRPKECLLNCEQGPQKDSKYRRIFPLIPLETAASSSSGDE
jgi:hypothetical protein